MKILFVCMSNICRSPYCEYVFRRIADNDGVLSKNITWIKSAAVFNKSFHINSKAKTALLREGFTEEEIEYIENLDLEMRKIYDAYGELKDRMDDCKSFAELASIPEISNLFDKNNPKNFNKKAKLKENVVNV